MIVRARLARGHGYGRGGRVQGPVREVSTLHLLTPLALSPWGIKPTPRATQASAWASGVVPVVLSWGVS